jgi:hypothetical protein
MYLIYVDESGDTGLNKTPTPYYVLSGLVLHELLWRPYLDELIGFRQHLKQQFGLRLREEFHASAWISRPGELSRIKLYDRLDMMRQFADKLASLNGLSLINVVVEKAGKPKDYDVFGMAWRALIQRFENTIKSRNFPGPKNADERGLILCDHTEDKKLLQLLRKMRRYNPVPSQFASSAGYRDLTLQFVIEDANFRDSANHYFIQAADLAASLLYQHLSPSARMRKKAGQNYFLRLNPVLCLHASSKRADGIVWL